MKINYKKLSKISFLILSLFVIFYFSDYALGTFMEGWSNPK
ncbi:hypothetical protein [uncultured Formosa sp.]|nr:hypothetical protein [uncultured Formosa sp.]